MPREGLGTRVALPDVKSDVIKAIVYGVGFHVLEQSRADMLSSSFLVYTNVIHEKRPDGIQAMAVQRFGDAEGIAQNGPVFVVNEYRSIRIGEDGKKLFVGVFLSFCFEKVRAALMMYVQHLPQQFVYCGEVPGFCFADGVTHCLSYFFAEREYGTEGHLEMLQAPGNSYDGDTEEEPAYEVDEGNLPPTEKYPDKVHYHRYAARLVGTVHQLVAKRPEGICTQLKELHSERYADDGYAHQQTDDVVYQGDHDTAQDEPDDVAEEFHSYSTSDNPCSYPVDRSARSR